MKWPAKLSSERAERQLLRSGPWSEVMPYFFAVDHRDRVGESAPLRLSALQAHVAQQLDVILESEIRHLCDVAKDGNEVYVHNFQRRMGSMTPREVVKNRVFSPYEIGVRINLCKSRRGGASTFFLAAGLRGCLALQNYSAVSWSETKESMKRIFRLQTHAVDNWRDDIHLGPEAAGLGRRNKEEQSFKNGSSHVAKTAGTSTRGDKFDFLHLTEYAHYNVMDDVKQSMGVARPHAWIVKETTANGVNHFYSDWEAGMTPNAVIQARMAREYGRLKDWSGFYNIFFPWWKDPGLTVALTAREEDEIRDSLDEYEDRLLKHTDQQVSMAHLLFRRRAMASFEQDDLEGLTPEAYFDQEYPWSPESAFQSSSRNVFPPDVIEDQVRHQTRPTFVSFSDRESPKIQRTSPIAIYEPPEPDQAYMVAADISHGIGWDYCEASFFKRNDGTRLTEVANVHSNRMNPGVFSWLIVCLAYFYNDAFIIGEAHGGGVGFNDSCLNKMGYTNIYHRGVSPEHVIQVASANPKLGVWWNEKLKGAAVNRLQSRLRESVIDDNLIIRTPHGLKQLSMFQSDGRKFGAPKGHNDDFVSMLLILMMGAPDAPPIDQAPDMVKQAYKIDPSSVRKKGNVGGFDWDAFAERVDRWGRRNQRRGRTVGVAQRARRR